MKESGLVKAVFLVLSLCTPVLSYAASWGAVRSELSHFKDEVKDMRVELTVHEGDRSVHTEQADMQQVVRRLERMEDKLDRLLAKGWGKDD